MDYSVLSVSEIQDILKKSNKDNQKKIIEELKNDNRKSILKLIEKFNSTNENHEKELKRINNMKKYEYNLFKKGINYIAGIDEVGRGSFAGPVYASAVIMPIDCIIEEVNDSKKLSPKKREYLYNIIKQNAICYATGFCDENKIDEVNILNATFIAMKQAIEKLPIKPEIILVDAVKIPNINIPQIPIIKGDLLSFSIAAASIIAKVERDEFMRVLHNEYPFYNFKKNKGYGTSEHIDAIKKYGICNVHRRSFINF